MSAPPEVVVLCGLQGSGKSTFFRRRFAATHVLVSRDLFRNHPHPSRRQAELIEAALTDGRSVVVDNTNPTLADRAAILAIARAHGARATCFYFGRDIRTAIARNARREGRVRVPVVGILSTAKRLVPPRADEGFDAVWEVEGRGEEFVERAMNGSTPPREGGPGGGSDPASA